MIFKEYLFFLFIFSSIDCSIYIYNTQDSSSIEFYDCIYHQSLFYCRQPKHPITLQRDQQSLNCSNNGIVHSFQSLSMNNINVSTRILEWKSGVDKAEEYSHYQSQSNKSNGNETYLCQCTHPRSFGINCEYLLPNGTTFADAASEKFNRNSTMRMYGGDIVCYTTIKCNSGLLCLDWREICDNVQNCMSGYDEENCDKLEFNECEKDEYRCMNGMCIPDEYWMDGEYDCMDMSDEKELFVDLNCPSDWANFTCDERLCPPVYWSCGDGQCIWDRNAFRFNYIPYTSLCISRRDQYYICEANPRENLWTLPNGQCYKANAYEELNHKNFSIDEYCIYLFKCSLQSEAEKYCSCNRNNECVELFVNICSSSMPIQYPKGGLLTPYGFQYHNVAHKPLRFFSFAKLRGTIKCRGYMSNFSLEDNFPFAGAYTLTEIETNICTLISNFSNKGDHQFCHNGSITFSNNSYNFIDVCTGSRECISSYRISDGFSDCYNKSDENQENEIMRKSCSNVQRHRFRCSADQSTCLYANKLGDLDPTCKNKYDESWMGTQIMLSKIHCNNQIKDGCQDLRRYIEISWKTDDHNQSSLERISSKQIPFRSYCDTFWDLSSNEDENRTMCQSLWICSKDQWQCYTGQCIHFSWVLDGVWDCPDASDEQNVYNVNYNTLHHNSKRLTNFTFRTNFIDKYAEQPFGKMCNLTSEYPCLPINMLFMSNDTRPCVDLKLIGDGQVDCIGGYDERNAIKHCNKMTTLGYNFKCLSDNTCIHFSLLCTKDNRCSNRTDDHIWCSYYENIAEDIVFKCRNGTRIKEGRCDGKYDCFDGEDEYMCDEEEPKGTIYRSGKERHDRTEQKNLYLPHFPVHTKATGINNTSVIKQSKTSFAGGFNILPRPISWDLGIPYWCNRGIGSFLSNGSIVCFCPPQYHGDQCQFHSDRITLFLHLNLTQSIYSASTDRTVVIKLVVLFFSDDQVLDTDEIHIRPATEFEIPKKKRTYFHYSRSFESLQIKRERYFNRSDVINRHPYSLRIEAYEMKMNVEPKRLAVWQYPIYFDFLPVYRLAKVLRLTKPNADYNVCKTNPCNQNEDCYQLISKNSQHICLCKSNYFGPSCSKLDPLCTNNFCSSNAHCKPSYRGLTSGMKSPYCICPLGRIGRRCQLVHSICSQNPCKNNGACYHGSRLDDFSCRCTAEYRGKTCENKKQAVKLFFNGNNTIEYEGIVIQYFNIDLSTLQLKLVNQSVYSILPNSLLFLHNGKTAPEIVLLKMYWLKKAEIYLISLHINVTSIEGNTSITEHNRCIRVHSFPVVNGDISVFHYHQLCRKNHSLFCFRDDNYICICDEEHYRTECFGYDDNLDHCSNCLADGHCLKGEKDEYHCICPPCHIGKNCQFNFESFSFTLDQLFFNDLLSRNDITRQTTFYLLIITPCILFLLGLINNVFCFVTFRRPRCLRNGVGQYLFYTSMVNQLNLVFLVFRLIHMTVNIADSYNDPSLDNTFCKVSNYLLISSTRIISWLGSFIAIERIYVTLFLNGHWLKKPHIARRLIVLTIIIILIISAYEFAFIESQFSSDDGQNSMCVLNFPLNYSFWKELHIAVTIINALVPFLINLCCTIGIICIVTKKKMNANARDNSKCNPVTIITTTNDQEVDVSNKNGIELTITKSNLIDEETIVKSDVIISEIHLSPSNAQSRFRLLIDVITENKELVLAPAIILVPQLFSLPFFIASFSLGCQDLRSHYLRYLLVVSYFTTFVPPLTSFFLYISPSSFYSKEWHFTNAGKWIKAFKQRHHLVTFTTKTSNFDGTTK